MKYVPKNPESVTAWKYEGKGKANLPVMVACKCYIIVDGQMAVNTPSGVMLAEVGDYVVLVNEELNAVVVMNGKEFEAEYEPEF